MKAGRDRLLRWLLLPSLVLASGCAVQQQNELARALKVEHGSVTHRGEVAARYVVHCPDILAIQLGGAHAWKGFCPVGPDGRITVMLGQPIRVEGLTPPEIARVVAKQTGTSPEEVQVSIAEYQSQQIYLMGEIQGLQRTVPYRGPETVLELLQRVGGISAGAAPGNIQVVRANVAEGTQPEVFQVDLDAIIHKKEPESNIRLEPFDQVYIGQTRRHIFAGCLPPWLQPLYHTLTGTRTAQ